MMVHNEVAVEKHETVQENMSKEFAYDGDIRYGHKPVSKGGFLLAFVCLHVNSLLAKN